MVLWRWALNSAATDLCLQFRQGCRKLAIKGLVSITSTAMVLKILHLSLAGVVVHDMVV